MNESPGIRRTYPGICKLARDIGVSYNYLWKVLSGNIKAPGIVLRVSELAPQAFNTSICRIPYGRIVAYAKTHYVWRNGRYVLDRKYYRKTAAKA